MDNCKEMIFGHYWDLKSKGGAAVRALSSHQCVSRVQNTSVDAIYGLSYCLVPVRRFPSPSRSIHFGDVSEANGRETDHVTQNTLAARNNEA